MSKENSTQTLVYIGTYTGTLPHVAGKAEGIYVYQFDAATGALTPVSKATGIINPSFYVSVGFVVEIHFHAFKKSSDQGFVNIVGMDGSLKAVQNGIKT